MYVLFIFVAFQCVHEALFQSCIYTDKDYICKQIPTDYPAGLTSVIFFTSGLGEISLSMFNSTNLTSVNSLAMQHQDVTAIGPQTFQKFQNLKKLNLENNHLSRVSSDWFCHPSALEVLQLSNNKITTLDHNSLDGLSNLVMLNLSQNQVHNVTKSSFLGLCKLKQLDLSNNKLTHLSPDVFLPLNGTNIRLDGNPWDCSCSVEGFAKYLRGLKNASLLVNEMLVCCSSPPELQGLPVWQVRECKVLTTMSSTTTSLTTLSIATGSPATGNLAPILIIKPLAIGHSTLIILIVVLCALVLVICVLSVLYHRKRERKHLQAVKPSSEKSETIQSGGTTAKSNGEDDRKMKSGTANETQIATTEALLRTNQMVVGDEKVSQIYHIYSSGTFEARDPIKRVQSAGPVLCRTDMLAKLTEEEVVSEEQEVRNDEYYNGWMTSEKQKDNESMNIEKMEKLEDGKKIADKENEGFAELSGSVESHEESRRETNEDPNGRPKTGTRVDKDVPQWGSDNDVLDHMNELTLDAESSQDVLEGKQVTSESDELAENLPYLIIGADPEKQIPEVDPNTAKGASGPLRPIRRVLTWPPTAVQWKKQWAQNQQVLNVFPKLIFVTGCRHEIGPCYPSISPATLPTSPQFTALEFLPEVMSPDVRIAVDEDAYRASLEPCTQKVPHFSPQEDFSNANISLRDDCRVITNGEAWRSGFENSPVDESEVCSEWFSIFNPSFGGSKSKPAAGEEVINEDNIKEIQSVKKKTHQVASALQKQSRKAEKASQRAHRARRRGQVCNGSDSRVPPSGGSPKDDSLLLGNEYTFIDLLHEVVENHGRWTRDRWRQTQKNKTKLKQSR